MTAGALAAAIRTRLPRPRRALIALAGAPASGKSTLAGALAPGAGSAVVSMDGYHLDNAILDARGDRPRKGARDQCGRAFLVGHGVCMTGAKVAAEAARGRDDPVLW